MKKIVHVLINYAYSTGVPNLPFLIAFNFQKSLNNYNNTVLWFRKSDVTPDILNDIDNKHIGRLSLFYEILKIKPCVLLLHGHFGSLRGLCILLMSKLLYAKTIAQPDFDEYGFPRLNHKSIFDDLKQFLRYILIYLHTLLTDRIVCWTEAEKSVFVNRFTKFSNKFYVIPGGGDFTIETLEKENYILTVSGWWADRKNLHTILKVFNEVIKQKKCKLVIIGKFIEGRYHVFDEDRYETGEEYKKKIMGLIRDLNLEESVKFAGVVDETVKEELFKKAKIFYLPSKSETFGMVFVEAMASGTPVVAMKNSAVQYVVKDGVTGFLRNTEEGQKEAILRLLTDEKLYKQMQSDCLEEAEKYRWEVVVKEWEDLIEGLV